MRCLSRASFAEVSSTFEVCIVVRFLIRFSGGLLIAFALGALVFLVTIDSVFNGGFSESLKILWLPCGLAVLSFTYVNREVLGESTLAPWQMWVMAAMFYPLSLLFGWPYLMAINALSVNPVPHVYSGPVIAKFVTSGKSVSYHIRLRDVSSEETIELYLSKEAYSKARVGTVYCAAFHRGLFDIPFRWRFASSSVLEAACRGTRPGALTSQ